MPKIPSNIVTYANEISEKYSLNRDAVLAQWALESNWGKSTLVAKTNNPFNIKCFGDCSKQYLVIGKRKAFDKIERSNDYYRVYKTMRDGFHAYGYFIATSKRYAGFQAFKNDTTGYLQHLKNKGYATDKNYVSKALKVIDSIDGVAPATTETTLASTGTMLLGGAIGLVVAGTVLYTTDKSTNKYINKKLKTIF